MVTKAPTPNIPKKFCLLIEKSCFFKSKKRAKPTKAMPILYQTKWMASKEINFPKTPVNPSITTIKCSEVSLYSLSKWYMELFDNFVQ